MRGLKVIVALGLYGFLAAFFWLLYRKAPFDPHDPNTRDDEK